MRRWLLVLVALAVAALLRPRPTVRPGLHDAPPGLSLATTALGGFNGVAASYVWLHANRGGDQASPFELARAARWVTALQPGLGSLYDFQAWNLAYNVADTFGPPAERWPWVVAGLDLLYGEGLARRGADPRVTGALATLLLGRVCGGQDDAAGFYQQAFAAQWEPLVGPPPTRWEPLAPAMARWRMDAGRCAELDRTLGPFDWRTGWPHALYWARLAAGSEPSARRSRPHWAAQLEALRGACLDGRIVTRAGQSVFLTVPQPELARSVEALYEEAMAAVSGDPGFPAGRQTWRAESALMLAAFGYQEDEEAAAQSARALCAGDRATAKALIGSYEARAALCQQLGEATAARGLRGMARRMARTMGVR